MVYNIIETVRHKRKTFTTLYKVFKHFLKDCNDVQLLVPWDKLFQILGALNEKALPTNAFGGMGVFKEMLADDRRVLVGLYISIRS